MPDATQRNPSLFRHTLRIAVSRFPSEEVSSNLASEATSSSDSGVGELEGIGDFLLSFTIDIRVKIYSNNSLASLRRLT